MPDGSLRNKKHFAYSTLTWKALDGEDEGVIEGVASTPIADRTGDIVEPEGAEFKLPIPLLWQHNAREPIGHVIEAKVSKTGIKIKAKVMLGITDKIDECWKLIKAGLVRGLSIGFRGIETSYIEDTYAIRFLKWEWLELSPVTIPANADASIIGIKGFDRQERAAALGKTLPVVVLQHFAPGASGSQEQPLLKESEVKTIREQIVGFETKRNDHVKRMQELLQKAHDAGATLDAADGEEYDTLKDEVGAIDKHLSRLRDQEALVVVTAAPVAAAAATEGEASKAARSASPVIFSRRELPKGTAFTRFALALAHSKGNLMMAERIADRWKDTPEVSTIIKSAIAAGTTTDATWAGALVQYQEAAAEFIELLRPMTILGKLTQLRRVPFNIRMLKQTAGTTGSFVGEGLPKPVRKMDFTTTTLQWYKAATIIVMTEELVRFSNPNAEAVARQDLLAGIAEYLDIRFINPSYAGVANVSPASITNGADTSAASGATVTAILNDVETMMQAFVAAKLTLSTGAWIMTPGLALTLGLVRGSQDNFLFPGISMKGGEWMGLPVVVSESVPASTIVLVDQSEILLADDGDITLDMSTEASLQMDDSPSSGGPDLISLWQNNLLGLRAERYINWARRRPEAVYVLTAVGY